MTPMPDSLTLAAPAKVNLFLHVIGRRPDGYHLLQSVFELIDWSDEVRLSKGPGTEITRKGDLIGPAEQDLAVRAARALQATPRWRAKGSPGAAIEVRKEIPAGAGLGGGSSDAATTLMGLNRLWGLGLSQGQLAEIGLGLGADVPFFIHGAPAFVEGVGEKLSAIASRQRWLVLAVPRTPVATGAVFGAPELTRNTKPLKIEGFAEAAALPVWVFGQNDLEPVTQAKFPEVGILLGEFRRLAETEKIAPAAVRMSGSGGAVFCSAPDFQAAERLYQGMQAFQKSVQGQCLAHLRICKTLVRHPAQSH
jgi:4-diphosphocytidyl-2-C-methyl-D-erythritol kinase